MRGSLQRCAAAQQHQLQSCQFLGKPALVRSRFPQYSRASLRCLQATRIPDEPQPEPASPADQQQQLNAVASDQQQMSSDQQPEHRADQPPGQLLEPAADAQQVAAVAVAEYLGDEQAAEEEEELLRRPVREIDLAASKAAEVMYLAMGFGLAIAGLAMAVYAMPVAASCLKLGGMPLTQAAALVGCVGAGMLRAASLAFFLAGGASIGELGTWRYQRINLALMACGAITALIQPLSWSAVQPWLLAIVLTAAAAAVAAVCGRTFLQQWRQDGIIYASAVGYGDWIQGIQAASVYLLRDVSTLAGSLLAVLAVAATVGGLQSLTGSAAAVALPWLTGKAAAAQLAGLQYLHKLLGVGLLLTAVQCWALSEFAGQARHVSLETAIKVRMVAEQEQYEYISGQLPAPLHVPPSRFDLLHIGFFAAAVVQGLWLWTAASVGGPAAAGLVNFNSADAVWAPLYWSVLCSAAYLATNVFLIDFIVVWESFVGFASYLSGWVSFFTVILYADWEWLKEVRRR